MAGEPADLSDAAVEALLDAVPEAHRRALADAATRARSEDTTTAWRGGDQIGTTNVDGVERPVVQVPYSEPAAATLALVRALYEAGLVVPFDWQGWHAARERGAPLEGIGDAVRYVTAAVRADRFVDGSLAAVMDDGSLLAAVDVVLHWWRAHPAT